MPTSGFPQKVSALIIGHFATLFSLMCFNTGLAQMQAKETKKHMEALNKQNMTGRNNSGATPNDPVKCLAASSLIGDNIFNPSGDALGKIKDIMIDITDCRVEYVVIEFGGFLGINQKYFAIPLQALAIAKEHRHAFILNETKESLKRYPGFDKDHWPNTNSQVHPGKPNDSGFTSGDTRKIR